ncbi:MAG: 50S ribosomal protein L3 [Ruminococcaceae bacterium]|nr:50S ribosomal protein L3 [Oscillospiraceae bacterium]
MNKGIIGKKIGMTQIFDEKGNVIPVTIIEAGPCTVTQIKTAEKDGYEAVQLGFEEIAERKLSKAEAGHLKKNGLGMKKHLKEFRLSDVSGYNIGDTVTSDIFAAGEKVDVTGITKGHGYTGVIKRWNHHMLRATHGTGPVHREVGSMGANSSPSRVFKNKKMAGQYGCEQVTVLNLTVAKIDNDKNIIALKGAVPGARGGIVFIRDTVKH